MEEYLFMTFVVNNTKVIVFEKFYRMSVCVCM